MTEKKQKPLFRVTEKGKNFTMTKCEFQMDESGRPVLETDAENTRIEKIKVAIKSASGESWLSKLGWQVIVPLIVAVVAGVLLYMLTGQT